MTIKWIFWRRGKAEEIRKDIKYAERRVSALKIFEDQKEKSRNIINGIKGKMEEAKNDIRERATEQKARIVIDERFDPEIDMMAEEEIKAIERFEEDLDAYRDLVEEAKTKEELNILLEMLQSELKNIEDREKVNSNRLNEMERDTLAARMAASMPPIPPRKTSDGVKWRNIGKVAIRLGGEVSEGSGHQIRIIFPNSRPIPLSSDVSSEVIASEIVAALRVAGVPAHKIPTSKKISDALKSGGIKGLV